MRGIPCPDLSWSLRDAWLLWRRLQGKPPDGQRAVSYVIQDILHVLDPLDARDVQRGFVRLLGRLHRATSAKLMVDITTLNRMAERDANLVETGPQE